VFWDLMFVALCVFMVFIVLIMFLGWWDNYHEWRARLDERIRRGERD
jgi:high-affinity Fe2+/Pb2+ permease